MVDREFEAWWAENYSEMDDPLVKGIARSAWDGRMELLVKQFAAAKEDNFGLSKK